MIDIVPAILEATGISAPEVVDGIKQSPIEGVSILYTFDRKNADSPPTRKTQYFEMFGDRAIHHEGWIASPKVMRAPWVQVPPKESVLDYQVPFTFFGKLVKITLKVDRPKLSPEDIKKLEEAKQIVDNVVSSNFQKLAR